MTRLIASPIHAPTRSPLRSPNYSKWGVPAPGIITLSNSEIEDDALVGDLIGILSVEGGVGVFTFSITADPDNKVVLDGGDNTRLELQATVDADTATTHAFTISADNGVDPAFERSFTLIVNYPTLLALSLNNSDIDENSVAGTTVGTLSGMTTGSTLSIVDTASARFAIDGNDIEAGVVATDHSAATSHSITVRETLAGSPNSPKDTVFTITVNNVAPVLSSLSVTPNESDPTEATISVDTTDGDGTIYFVVVPTAATAPNAAQIVAGTDGSGTAATWDDSVAVVGIDTYTGGPSGLTEGAVYDCYAVQFDASGVGSNIVTAEFTASDPAEGGTSMGLLLALTYPVHAAADPIIYHVALKGQSLAVGTNGSPALTTAQADDNMMFTGGLKAAIASASQAGMVDMVEASLETGMNAVGEAIVDLTGDAENRIFGTNDAVGNTQVLGLFPETTSYDAFLSDMAAAPGVVTTAGYRYRMPLVIWRQSEADNNAGTTIAEYKRRLRLLRQLVENDAYRLNPNDAMPVYFITYQLSSHSDTAVGGSGEEPLMALALLDLAIDNDNYFAMSGPLYPYTHFDGVHLINTSYRRLGYLEGIIAKEILFDGVVNKPLYPTATLRSGSTITLTFNVRPGKQLVIDTTLVTDPGDNGFEVYESDGGAAMTINSVALVGTTQVLITCSATVPAGAVVGYALTSTDGDTGPAIGPRGNLRDNMAASVVADGDTYAVHNWCVHFKETVA
jgi:hypothetical protein